MSSNHKSKPPGDKDASVNGGNTNLLASVLPDLTLELDEDGYFRAFHGGDESDLYQPPEIFLNKHYSEIIPPQVSAKFDAARQQLSDTGEPSTITYLLPIRKELHYFECRFFGLDSGGALALIRNMTDTWRTKKALEQSESRYRTLVNNLPGVVYRCLLDENWTAVFVSESVAEMMGYQAQDFINGNMGLVDLIHPEDRTRVREEVMKAITQRKPFHISYRMVHANGRVFEVAERGQAVYGRDDEPDYLDGVFYDVSELHRMRQRLLINSKMAAVGNLAAGVAHEINNPLAIAMANLEYVSEELGDVRQAVSADEAVHHALSDVSLAVIKIQEGIDRVRNIIDDLRTFSDAAEGRADRLDAQRLVKWAIRRRFGQRVHDDFLDINLEPVPAVWASEVGLVQVIWNLLDNALEAIGYCPDDREGTIEISLFEQDGEVCFIIADNGPGMTDEVADRAFEPFFTTKSVGEGAGLGLFVCQGLVDSMNGFIELTSTPGEGTRVQVCLPSYQPTTVPYNGD